MNSGNFRPRRISFLLKKHSQVIQRSLPHSPSLYIPPTCSSAHGYWQVGNRGCRREQKWQGAHHQSCPLCWVHGVLFWEVLHPNLGLPHITPDSSIYQEKALVLWCHARGLTVLWTLIKGTGQDLHTTCFWCFGGPGHQVLWLRTGWFRIRRRIERIPCCAPMLTHGQQGSDQEALGSRSLFTHCLHTHSDKVQECGASQDRGVKFPCAWPVDSRVVFPQLNLPITPSLAANISAIPMGRPIT